MLRALRGTSFPGAFRLQDPCGSVPLRGSFCFGTKRTFALHWSGGNSSDLASARGNAALVQQLAASPRAPSRTTDEVIREYQATLFKRNAFLCACEKLRGAADLPERFVVEKLRPLWKPVLGEIEFYDEFSELHQALREAGPAGLAVLERLPAERSRYPVTEESLQAARTLRHLIPGRSRFKVFYTSIEQPKAEVRRVVRYLGCEEQWVPRLCEAVDIWFPVYQWAQQQGAEDGTGW